MLSSGQVVATVEVQEASSVMRGVVVQTLGALEVVEELLVLEKQLVKVTGLVTMAVMVAGCGC